MISLKEATEQLGFKQAFNAGNLSAFWEVLESGEMVYRVFSYQTEIARVDRNGEWLNPNKYSVTTSKHKNIIKRVWEMN